MFRFFLTLLFGGIFIGCATYQGNVYEARNLVEQGQYSEAVTKLEPLALKEGGDQLVYLLDYAVALQLSGDLKQSTAIFLKADRLVDTLDYHSVSRITGSLLGSEEMVQYKGDTFEKIFINAYLAMNFLSEGNLDEALVEARRMNEKYIKYRQDNEIKFKQNVFGKYLSAMAWEADKKYDDCYIAYKEAYQLDSNIPFIAEDLIRASKLARRDDEYKKWKSEFPSVKEMPEWYSKDHGELIVIHQQGWGPRKTYNSRDYRFPILTPYRVNTQSSILKIIKGETTVSYQSQTLYDVEHAAILTLQDDYSYIVAKRMAGVVAKEVAADQIRQKNELLGNLIWIAMHVSDRADLRQWSSLPQKVEVIRTYLPKGNYSLALHGLSDSGVETQEFKEFQDIKVMPGKKKFIIWRTLK